MESLKRILKSALADRSPRFMLATIALGVVVALLAGTLIGYKLDNRNGSTSTSKATTTTAKKLPVVSGTVVAARPAKIGVLGAGNKRVPLVVTKTTKVEVARPGSSSSITVGSHVLYAAQAGNTTTAAEVVVLPSTSRLGTLVTAVTPTAMTLNRSVVVQTSGATVSMTVATDRTQIRIGSRVEVAYVATRRNKTAIEVAILPAGSTL